MMEINNQAQTGGDNSTQIQGNVINMYGITEQRAREICSEEARKVLKKCVEESEEIARKRVNNFIEEFIPRIRKIEKDLKSFADPAFITLVQKAISTVTCTERNEDYENLSELLAQRVKNKSNIKRTASITKVVEILYQIDDDALCGLTTYYSVKKFIPTKGSSISDSLSSLNSLLDKIMYMKLPSGYRWIDHLYLLGMIQTIPYKQIDKIPDCLIMNFNGYVCIGIRKNSENHNKASEIIKSNDISGNILVENEFCKDYVRLNIVNKFSIDNMDINQYQKEALRTIWNMYEQNSSLQKKIDEKFNEQFSSFQKLSELKSWWNSISPYFILTSAGEVLAHVNANRCYDKLPTLDM